MIVLRDGKIIDVLMETADRYTLMRVSGCVSKVVEI